LETENCLIITRDNIENSHIGRVSYNFEKWYLNNHFLTTFVITFSLIFTLCLYFLFLLFWFLCQSLDFFVKVWLSQRLS